MLRLSSTLLLEPPKRPTMTLAMSDLSDEITPQMTPASETANTVTVAEIAEETDMEMKK